MHATYNITDDKIKVWFDSRLSDSDYQRAKAARFVWWPCSKCFVAKWSPEAEDFVTGCGIEIAEDDTPDNVEARVERFAEYAEKAESNATSAEIYLAERANTKRRRMNATNRIERELGAAEHWQRRIEGAIRHAAYKERADVIARRIKGLGADLRKWQREADEAAKLHVAWSHPTMTKDRALYIANYYDHGQIAIEGKPYPATSYWSALKDDLRTVSDVAAHGIAANAARVEHAARWIAHIEDRIAYETAACKAAGGTDELINPPRSKGKSALPLLNLRGEVLVRELYSRGEATRYTAEHMTKAQFAAIPSDLRGTLISACGGFRVRLAVLRTGSWASSRRVVVFLTDSAEHQAPSKAEAAA